MTSTSTRCVLVAASAAVLDWTTKAIAATTLDDGRVEIGAGLTLRLSHNTGVAFGMGDQLPDALLLVVTVIITTGLAVAAVRGSLGPWWASGLVLGGAAANVVDRAIGGSVVDFADLGWWPSFNLADVFLVCGCALLVLTSLRAPTPIDAPPIR